MSRPLKTLNGGSRSSNYELTEPIALPGAECEVCKGAGFVIPFDPKEPNKIQRATPCPRNCNQSVTEKAARLTPVEVPESLKDKYHYIVQPAVNDILERIEAKSGGLVLLAGPYGIGKSHIVKAAVREGMTRNLKGQIYEAEELLQEIRNTYNQNGQETESAIIAKLKTLDILGIDEADRTSDSPWAAGKLFQVINLRWKSTESHPELRKLTILTTNKEPEKLDGYLKSRLGDRNSRVFKLWGAPDIRRLRGRDEEAS